MTDCQTFWKRAYQLVSQPFPSLIDRAESAMSSVSPLVPGAGLPGGAPPPPPPSSVDAAAAQEGTDAPVEEDCQTCPDCQIVTADMLAGSFDRASAAERQIMADEINLVIDEAGLGSELRLSHFVGQCRQETAGHILRRESLDYSPAGLRATFGYYGNHPKQATAHGRGAGKPADQQTIANHAYGGRIGNGSIASGDGWLYRGRGIKQLTGRGNYKDFTTFHKTFWGEDVDFEANPDLLATDPKYAVRSGIYFWAKHNLGPKADAGPSRPAADSITDVVNRYDGDVGYTNRYNNMRKAYESHVFKPVCFNTTTPLSNKAARKPK